MSCEDSHVLCCGCEKYLYPREIAGTPQHEEALTPAVEAWLQVLGRSRNWWREMDHTAGPGCHGIRNFGNTCFFTSTVQALLHSGPLCSALREAPLKADGWEIQHEFLALQRRYWGNSPLDVQEQTIDPRGLWDAVVANAVFGDYAETAMEDANTLLLDLLDALHEPTVHATFGVTVSSQTNCSICAKRRRAASRFFSRLFPRLPARVCDGIAECTAGAPFTSTCTETVISLPLVSEAAVQRSPVVAASGNPSRAFSDASEVIQSKLAGQARIGACFGEGETEAPVAELLGAYLAPEWIEDYRCEHCKTLGKVMKRFSIQSTSDGLVLNLKRFATTMTGTRIKVHRRVSVPSVLDLTALLGSQSLGAYELSSMVVHDGGMGGGHYMAYARRRRGTSLTNEWMWFSDQHFGPVDDNEVMNAEPFLLFYQRIPQK